MKINLFFGNYLGKKHLLLLSILTLQLFTAQLIPTNSRSIQLNTLKGSVLNILESTESHVFHVGTANAELGFDGYTYSNVGIDDLFILKSNSADGSNVWIKTFNAGEKGNISPKKVYIDGDDNVFVLGNFEGILAFAGETINSTGVGNTFLLKLDAAGNEIWIKSFANQDPNFIHAVKMDSDNTDLFMIFSRNRLVRMNKMTGAIIYDNVLNNDVSLRGISLRGNNIYVAGYAYNTNITLGSETIVAKNGFIVKGDKEGNFTASIQTVSSSTYGADIGDIAFDSEGQLLLTGFSNSSTQLRTATGLVSYTYNPAQPILPKQMYYYMAKIDPNLETVAYLKNSQSVRYGNSQLSNTFSFNSKILPYGNAGQFRLVINLMSYAFPPFISPNGSIVDEIIDLGGSSNRLSILTSSDHLGAKTDEAVAYNGSMINSSSNSYVISTNKSRLFTTKSYSFTNPVVQWTKQKESSVGGTLSSGFVKHLNSAKDELFVSTIVTEKGNFFGISVNNSSYVNSRHFARLGNDGLPKWTAKFSPDTDAYGLTNLNEFAVVDQDDNFIIMPSTSGTSSTFSDANGQSVVFEQNADQISRAIIKLDKNGNLIWSKKMTPTTNMFTASLRTDLNGDIYMIGNAMGNSIEVDNIAVGANNTSSIFFLKLNGLTGAVIYAKTYPAISINSMRHALDDQNNMYVFIEPSQNYADYNFDGFIIPKSENGNQLMIKVDSVGKVIWGKNFYANNITSSSGTIYDVKFDGQDFILNGLYARSAGMSFTGLDLENISAYYETGLTSPFIAKISTTGSVIWQKPLYRNDSSYSNYTNIDVDAEKSIYMYNYVKNKMNIDNIEYSFDPLVGNSVLQKFNTTGSFQYNIIVDKATVGKMLTDVIDVDQINVLGYTTQNTLLNYPVNNNNSSNFYIATFGKLAKKYLTPEKNYLELESAIITNNPLAADNQFSFNLINNVDWTATSDQSWLNLSFANLGGKGVFNTINGNGDAKITLTANQNNSSATRSSNVNISGEGVAGKTIVVTQETSLGTGNNQISVITMYPNPTSDYLNIKSDKGITLISVYDMSGRLLINSKLSDSKIDVSKLQKGMYIIKLHTESGVINSKFIKN